MARIRDAEKAGSPVLELTLGWLKYNLTNMETWKSVAGFEGAYEVSDLGRVRSVPRNDTRGSRREGKVMSLALQKNGYVSVMLSQGGQCTKRWVHRLVLESFVGAPDGRHARHGPKGSAVNTLANLCWGTRRENSADQVRDGTRLVGMKVTGAKFGPEHRRQALDFRAAGCSYSQIALELGCSLGKAWKLVNQPTKYQEI